MTEGIDGIEARGSASWCEAEDNPDGCGKENGDDIDPGIEEEGDLNDSGEPVAEPEGKENADDASDTGEGNGLDEELEEDFAGASADGEANTNFACALGDGD